MENNILEDVRNNTKQYYKNQKQKAKEDLPVYIETIEKILKKEALTRGVSQYRFHHVDFDIPDDCTMELLAQYFTQNGFEVNIEYFMGSLVAIEIRW